MGKIWLFYCTKWINGILFIPTNMHIHKYIYAHTHMYVVCGERDIYIYINFLSETISYHWKCINNLFFFLTSLYFCLKTISFFNSPKKIVGLINRSKGRQKKLPQVMRKYRALERPPQIQKHKSRKALLKCHSPSFLIGNQGPERN